MQYLTIVSNFIYMFSSFYLIYKEYYLYGLLGYLIFIISYIYHSDTESKIWNWKMNADIIISFLIFIFVLHKCHNTIKCVKNLILLALLLLIFVVSYYYYYVDMNKYYLLHSLWHIYSGLFILYIFLEHENLNNS